MNLQIAMVAVVMALAADPALAAADSYRRPTGKVLKRNRRAFRTPRPNAPPDDTYRYRASKADYDACDLKSRCSPNSPARKVTRSIYEGARDLASPLDG